MSKRIKDFSEEDIENMNYNELISITRETNRIPGGKRTVFEIVNRLHLNEKSKVLEIGTCTGFTSIELSRLVKCDITAIDINKLSLKEAEKRAKELSFDNINFKKADVNNLPFEDDSFDLIIIGNIFSLLEDKEKSLKECTRVCSKNGFLATVPMYYVKTPSDKLINNVSEAIQVKLTPMYKKDWIDFFSVNSLDFYWTKDFIFDYIEEEEIYLFANEILNSEHLKELKKETYNKLKEKYNKDLLLFRDNLSYMGFTILILSKKRLWEDRELYTSRSIG